MKNFNPLNDLIPARRARVSLPPATRHTWISLILATGSLGATLTLSAQSTVEFSNGSGPSGSGSTLTNQVVTFTNNANNPGGNTFTPYTTPTTTVTFALSNQQYTLPVAQNANQAGVSFGAANNTSTQSIVSYTKYPLMNAISSPSNSNFTSGSTAGSGIDITQNYATDIFTSGMGPYNAGASSSGRFYMADLTITFSFPITNPIIHVVGMGGAFNSGAGSLGFATELELQTGGITLSKLSGSAELNVTATKILNSAAHPAATTGAGAATGSIQATGNNITTMKFKIFLRGDGVIAQWSNATQHSGDIWFIGISSLSTAITLPVDLSAFSASPDGNENRLQWTTAKEENAAYFDVEYSQNGYAWENIGQVKASGNSNRPENYQFIHHAPSAGTDYYRLREVDLDGKAIYSDVRSVQAAAAVARVRWFPNPVTDKITLINEGVSTQTVTLLTLDGKPLQTHTAFTSGSSIDMSPYPSGIYLLSVRNAAGNNEIEKIKKN
jgi:hypothetical protein